ncbi:MULTISPECIES: hypothetical protein [unclassified Mesorhizobium]|uniref:hypothetical protein n=1 Tax=unclassified Mesorhizobium TaxID=325217 RepID=UPI0030145CEC
MFFRIHTVVAAAATLCLVSTFSAQAEDLVFTLKNGTNSVLSEFYTSPVGVGEWEEDVFGSDVLSPGESISITIADGRSVCEYDMRFEFTEESDLDTTTDKADLCELGEYTITE